MKIEDIKKMLVAAAKDGNNITINKSKNKTAPVKKPSVKFPRLLDTSSKMRDTLDKEFGTYIDSVRFIPYTIAYLTRFLQMQFGTNDFSSINSFSRAKNDDSGHFDVRVADDVDFLRSGFQPSLVVDNDKVVLKFKNLRIPVAYTLYKSDDWQKNVRDTFAKIFPDFQMPTKWQRNSNKKTDIDLVDSHYSSGLRNLRFFAGLNFNGEPRSNDYYQSKMDLSNWPGDKSVYNIIFASATLNGLSLTYYNPPAAESSGSLADLSPDLVTCHGEIIIEGQIRLPLEAALWCMHAATPQEFIPKVFFDFVNQVLAYQGGRSSSNPGRRVMSIEKVVKNNEDLQKSWNYTPKIRSNPEGYLISPNNHVVYIPTVNNAAFYNKLQHDGYNIEDGTVKSNSQIPEMANQSILTDWQNEAYVYTDTGGNVVAYSLNGAVALDPVTISLYLNRPFGDLFTYGSGIVNVNEIMSVLQIADGIIREFNIANSMNFSDDDYISKDITQLYNFLKTNLSKYSLTDLAFGIDVINKAQKDSPEVTDYIATSVQTYFDNFVRLCAAIADKMPQSRKYSVQTIMRNRFWFTLIGQYMRNSLHYSEKLSEGIKSNQTLPVEAVPSTVVLPNMPGLKSFLPHQASLPGQAALSPRFMVYDCAPGAGKTLMGITDIIIQKQKGLANRAFIFCPRSLVKEWVNEINSKSLGRINAVAISSEIVQKMQDHLGFDRAKFIEYIKRAPINTIFVVDFNFLKLRTDKFNPENKSSSVIKYGQMDVDVYPQAVLFRQLEPDMVVLDESQNAKNRNSRLAGAIKQVFGDTQRCRLASGTLIQNLSVDMVSQFGLMNPAILGSSDQFYAKYGMVDDSGKLVSMLPNAGSMMSKDMLPYVTRIVRRRADWGFLLPQINQQFIQVKLTENQQNFYETILDQTLDDIKRDKNLQKLLNEGDSSKEKQIERALRKHLSPMEIFINAPETNEAFSQLSGITKEDLVSPKSKMAEQILHYHFNGGTLQIGSSSLVFKADKNKVIVFCYNIAATKSMFNYLKDRFPCLLYLAGDKNTITQFRQDPKWTVLVAAETTMREGLNLQVASRQIRSQTIWTPGAMEQASSRVLRPDVGNLYRRNSINLDWLVCANTFEVPKVARLLSKIVTNARVSESQNSRFNHFIENSNIPELAMFSMNIDSIRDYRNFNDLMPYFQSYGKLQDWEQSEFDLKKAELVNRVAQKLKVPPNKVTDDELKTNAMIPVNGKDSLIGSKGYFVPLPAGAMPVDHRDLDLKPLAIIRESDDDDDDDDDSDEKLDENSSITYSPGDIVQTEYGFGTIRSIYVNAVRVIIPGFTDESGINLNKGVVYKPTNETAIKKLKADLKTAGKKGITFTSGQAVPQIAVRQAEPPKQITLPQPNPKPAIDLDDDADTVSPKQTNKDVIPAPERGTTIKKGMPLELEASIINGQPIIFLFNDDKKVADAVRAVPGTRWRQTKSFVYRHVRTYNAAVKLVDALKKNFVVNSGDMDAILKTAKILAGKDRATQMVQTNAKSFNLKNFLNLEHTPTKNSNGLKVYPIVWDGELYICGVKSIQPQTIKSFARLVVPGVGPVETHDPMIFTALPGVRKASMLLQKMSTLFKIPTKNLNTQLRYLKGYGRKISNPDE